jgi:Fe2+ or Zn2+ uptake regulation protein
MDKADSILCTKIFELTGITPTPVRTILLTIMFQRSRSFSTKDIIVEVANKKLSIGASTVITTIKLFHVRGIIRQLPPPLLNEKAGRPEKVFVLDAKISGY